MNRDESITQNNYPNPARPKRLTGKAIIILSLLTLFVLFAGFMTFRYFNNRDNTKTNSVTDIQDATALKGFVSQLIEVPANETPTMATVEDKTKLANQEFFKNAENGDKVLIFEQAKKAYLYRPSTNKIVEVTLISPDNNKPDTNSNTLPVGQ